MPPALVAYSVARECDQFTRPAEPIAAVLRRACPASALGFALAMHERLCERGEHEHAELWLGAVRRLKADARSDRVQPAR